MSRHRRAVLVIFTVTVAAPGGAWADDALGVRAREAEATAGERWLSLDPVVPPMLRGLGAAEARERKVIRLGPSVTVAGEGSWWEQVDKPGRPMIDVEARGWRAAVRATYDAGPFQLEASGSIDHIDQRDGSGTYREAGLTVSRTFKLSRWMTAWIALGVGRRWWQGTAPAGEADATQTMLTIGTTFR
jgi:hypothetical protein